MRRAHVRIQIKMFIDVHTMQIVLSVTSLLMATTLWIIFPGQSRDGLNKWALALVSQSFSWLLLATTFIESEAMCVVVSSMAFSVNVALKAISLLEFQQRPVPRTLPLILPLCIAALFFLFPGNVPVLMLLNGAAYGVAYFGIAWLMWQPPYTTSIRVRWLMIGAFMAAAIGFIVRAVVGVFNLDVLPYTAAENGLQTISYLFGFILVMMSSTGVILMHKERADEQTRRLATTDPLTGVYNRRTFIELADMALARAQRTRTPLSLLMLDLDHFKRVNDQHGHLVGDQVLKSFVRVVETCLRREDLLVRFGGEEFCVLLPDTTHEGAMALAERVRALIADTPLQISDTEVRVTVSFGVDTMREGEPGNVDLLLHRADQALYRAKRSGRNRVAGYAPA